MFEDLCTADGDDQVPAGHRNFQDSVRIDHHTLTTLWKKSKQTKWVKFYWERATHFARSFLTEWTCLSQNGCFKFKSQNISFYLWGRTLYNLSKRKNPYFYQSIFFPQVLQLKVHRVLLPSVQKRVKSPQRVMSRIESCEPELLYWMQQWEKILTKRSHAELQPCVTVSSILWNSVTRTSGLFFLSSLPV